MICEKCSLDYPQHLIAPVEQGTIDPVSGRMRETRRDFMCPICALNMRNAQRGLPPETPFDGPQARRSYNSAVYHLRTTKQEHPSWKVTDAT